MDYHILEVELKKVNKDIENSKLMNPDYRKSYLEGLNKTKDEILYQMDRILLIIGD